MFRKTCGAFPLWGDGALIIEYHFNVGGGKGSLNLMTTDNLQNLKCTKGKIQTSFQQIHVQVKTTFSAPPSLL